MPTEISYAQLVGQVIRGRRELANITLSGLAESAQLSSASGWSRVETGDTIMNLTQLRKAAQVLNVEPWTILQQTDHLAKELTAKGIVVHDEKPKTPRNWILGGAAILALAGGVAAAASRSSKGESTKDEPPKETGDATDPVTRESESAE
jgi:transcriptional regulator with XRE-family HTH domain